jgi:hypothetical protein
MGRPSGGRTFRSDINPTARRAPLGTEELLLMHSRSCKGAIPSPELRRHRAVSPALPTSRSASKTLESWIRQVRIGPMKTITRSLLSFFSIAVATAFAVFLISSFPAATARTSTASALDRNIPSVDSAEQQAVLAPIMQMFDGMAKRDAAAIKKPLLSGGTMVLMRDGKPTQMTFEDFANRVGKPGTTQIQERIHDPLVRIDNDLAVVWAPFEFLVDGKVDHCGTDLFNVVRADGQWLIASVADTGRKDCASK